MRESSAVEAAAPLRKLPAYERQAVLNHCVQRFTERAEELEDRQVRVLDGVERVEALGGRLQLETDVRARAVRFIPKATWGADTIHLFAWDVGP